MLIFQFILIARLISCFSWHSFFSFKRSLYFYWYESLIFFPWLLSFSMFPCFLSYAPHSLSPYYTSRFSFNPLLTCFLPSLFWLYPLFACKVLPNHTIVYTARLWRKAYRSDTLIFFSFLRLLNHKLAFTNNVSSSYHHLNDVLKWQPKNNLASHWMIVL